MGSKVKRFLRSPRLITAELAVLSASLLLTTVLPQRMDETAWERFAQGSPRLTALLIALGLDAVTKSPWFLAVVLLAGGSLGVVLVEQWQRFARQWGERLLPAHFHGAPFRIEFERPAPAPGREARFSVRTTGRIGLLGSPLFHSGLMVILLSGLLRLLFFQQALVPLLEGETLAPIPTAYAAQDGSWLSRPFALAEPMRLLRLMPENYASGDLKGLSAEVEFPGAGSTKRKRVAINAPLSMGFETLYLNQNFGPAVLCRWGAGGLPDHRAVMLRSSGFEPPEARVGKETFPGDFEVRLRGYLTGEAPKPARFEVRILRAGALLFSGDLRPGQGARLATGETLVLLGLAQWAEFRGTRDYSVWPAYLGFALAGLGALLMFAVIKVDEAVLVTPCGGAENVVIALRAARFAPLYQERFQSLIQRENNHAVVQ